MSRIGFTIPLALAAAAVLSAIALTAAVSAQNPPRIQQQQQQRTQPPRQQQQKAQQQQQQQQQQQKAQQQTQPQPAMKALGLRRNTPDELGQVPDHFFWLRAGLQAAQDPLDGQLVFFNDEGHVVGRALLPAGFAIGQIAPGANAVRLIDVTGRRQISIARNLDTGALRSVAAIPVTPDGTARAGLATRRSPQLLMLRDEQEPGARALAIRSITGAVVAQAYDIGSGGEPRYVVSEEIVGTSPSLKVRVFVRRYNRAGEVTGLVYVPIDDLEVVPHDFITVTGNGVVRVLAPTASGVKLREYEFTAPPRSARTEHVKRRLDDAGLRRLGRALREIPVDSAVTGDTRGFRPDAGTIRVGPVATPPIARDAMLQKARAYLTVNWVMQRDNFSKAGIENLCQPQQARFWMRPRHFSEATIGQTIGPMPYRWGGEDTPQSYKLRVELGALAGDICTCRDATLNYCLVADSAGVDCSGFVSRAWGIEKRGTAGLLDVADDVKDLADLKPGDAFDWPQRHIRLFIGPAPGPETAFTVLESTTRLDCEGVCEATYRPSELNGYRLIRYRGATDNTVATTGSENAAPAAAPAAEATAGGNQKIAAPRSPKRRVRR